MLDKAIIERVVIDYKVMNMIVADRDFSKSQYKTVCKKNNCLVSNKVGSCFLIPGGRQLMTLRKIPSF